MRAAFQAIVPSDLWGGVVSAMVASNKLNRTMGTGLRLIIFISSFLYFFLNYAVCWLVSLMTDWCICCCSRDWCCICRCCRVVDIVDVVCVVVSVFIVKWYILVIFSVGGCCLIGCYYLSPFRITYCLNCWSNTGRPISPSLDPAYESPSPVAGQIKATAARAGWERGVPLTLRAARQRKTPRVRAKGSPIYLMILLSIIIILITIIILNIVNNS